MNDAPHTITLTLTDEEESILTALAQEQGLNAPVDALRILLHDAVAMYDALWDKTFAESQDVLDALAEEARVAYESGLAEDFDPDTDPNMP